MYSSSYMTGSHGDRVTPPHSVYPAGLKCSDRSSGGTRGGSGSHLSNLLSVPHSVRYSGNSVSPVTHSGGERKQCLCKESKLYDNENDIACYFRTASR